MASLPQVSSKLLTTDEHNGRPIVTESYYQALGEQFHQASSHYDALHQSREAS